MTVKPVAWHISEDSWRRVTSWTSAAIVYHLPRYWFWNWIVSIVSLLYCPIYDQFADNATNSDFALERVPPFDNVTNSDFALERVLPFGSSGWEGSSLGLKCIILRRSLPLTSLYRPSNFAVEKVSPFGCSGREGYFLGLECIMWWSVTHAVIRGVERAIWGRNGELR